MTYRGKVKNGVVVPDDPKALPEGADVEILLLPTKKKTTAKKRRPPTVGKGLRSLAGKGVDLPARPAGADGTNQPGKATKAKKGHRSGLMKFAGMAKDLPADAAENLDHYLYGHPKK